MLLVYPVTSGNPQCVPEGCSEMEKHSEVIRECVIVSRKVSSKYSPELGYSYCHQKESILPWSSGGSRT